MQGKRYLILVFVLLFLIGVPGSGYSCSFRTGNEFVECLRGYENAETGVFNTETVYGSAIYMGYIAGVADALDALNVINFEGKTYGQAYAVVAKYLKVNPEKWHHMAYLLVIEALMEAFPKEQ